MKGIYYESVSAVLSAPQKTAMSVLLDLLAPLEVTICTTWSQVSHPSVLDSGSQIAGSASATVLGQQYRVVYHRTILSSRNIARSIQKRSVPLSLKVRYAADSQLDPTRLNPFAPFPFGSEGDKCESLQITISIILCKLTVRAYKYVPKGLNLRVCPPCPF